MVEFLPVALIAIIFVLIMFFMVMEVRRQQVLLKKQAGKRNGVFKKGGMFATPKLILPHGSQEIEVFMRQGSRNRPPYTYVRTQLSLRRDYKLKIARKFRIFGVSAVFGQDIEVGNPDFDKAFVTQGSDTMIARNFLNSALQKKLFEAKDFNPTITIQKGQFVLFVPKSVKTEEKLDPVIDLGLAIIKRINEMG